MSRLNAFIDHLIDFLDDLRQTFHEVIEIQTAYNQLKIWGDSTAVKRATLKSFMYCSTPCYEEIFLEKEEFFTDLENVRKGKGFQKFGGENDQEQTSNMMTLLQLKHYWADLTETNKEKIWVHIKALLVNGAATLVNTNYEPKDDQDAREWEELKKKCIELLSFIKKHPELYRKR